MRLSVRATYVLFRTHALHESEKQPVKLIPSYVKHVRRIANNRGLKYMELQGLTERTDT